MLQRIDEDTIYSRYFFHFGFKPQRAMPILESTSVCKRFIKKSEAVIVYRCILDDELYPTPTGYLKHDEDGYIVITEDIVNNQLVSTVKFLAKLRFPFHSFDAPNGLLTDVMMSSVQDYLPMAMKIFEQYINERQIIEATSHTSI